MKRLLLFHFLFICFSYSSIAQETILKGKVVDAKSAEPLAFASVFLNNTTIGTVTSEDGTFSLSIPSGQHEIITSFMGYEPLSFQIDTESMPASFLIQLVPLEVEMSEVEVTGTRDDVWYKNLETFKLFFLGSSMNAQVCEILNPEVLIIIYDEQQAKLTVRARDQLKILNPRLGYEISYSLVRFEYYPKEGTVFFGGYPFFKSIGGNNRQIRRAERQRIIAYNGSVMHFMRSLQKGLLEEEKFAVRRMYRNPNPNRPTQDTLDMAGKRYRETRDPSIRDSLMTHYLSKANLPKIIESLDKRPITVDELVEKTPDGKYFLRFEGYHQIVYAGEKEEAAFLGMQNRIPVFQTSVMSLLKDRVEIDPLGGIVEPFEVLFEGYMGWEKIGDMLPLDYQLPTQ